MWLYHDVYNMIDLSACQKKTSYFEKDCLKFRMATKLISRGSPNSSSHAYAVAAGKSVCNTGQYVSKDIVAISAEGKRSGRVSPDFGEISKAMQANVQTFITDTSSVRKSSYNIGEQQVAVFLQQNGYEEINGSGRWTRDVAVDNNCNKRTASSALCDDLSKHNVKKAKPNVVVNEITGDLLEPPMEAIIVQQCNTVSVYPKGLSQSIGTKFPYANIYSFRRRVGTRNLAVKQDRPQLGTCLLSFPPTTQVPPNKSLPLVANLFAQQTPGPPIKSYKILDEDNETEIVDTTEERKQWFRMALDDLKSQLEICQDSLHNVPIWFPYKCGCGLACSKERSDLQWQEYKQMIFEFASACPFAQVSIVRQPI